MTIYDYKYYYDDKETSIITMSMTIIMSNYQVIPSSVSARIGDWRLSHNSLTLLLAPLVLD